MPAMDTEIMKVAEEFASFDLLKPKNGFSPSFYTQETDSMIIISAQLKGYRQTNIKVDRNEDGSRIIVSGEKLFQDMLVIGGKVVKKDIETQRFQKSFKILQEVVLDKIKVKFDDDASKLMIRIPKITKGIMGGAIEEKTEEIPPESTKMLQVYTNREFSEQENQESEEENVHDPLKNDKKGGLQGQNEFHDDKQGKEISKQEQGEANPVGGKDDERQEPISHPRRFKICTPIIFGSAFFVSLIVMVFHLVQSEKTKKQKK